MDNTMKQKLQEMARQQRGTTEKLLSFVPSFSGEWRAGKEIFEMAQTSDFLAQRIDSLLNDSKTNTSGSIEIRPPIIDDVQTHKHQEYYVSNEKLYYRGIGRREGYEYSIGKERFQKIIHEIEGFLGSRDFRTDMLKRRLEGIPTYQVHLVLRLLSRRLGLLASPHRGWYRFVDTLSFPKEASKIWGRIAAAPIER